MTREAYRPDEPTIKCEACNGRGEVADYVGLEMKCVGVECWNCRGTGREPSAVTARQEKES